MTGVNLVSLDKRFEYLKKPLGQKVAGVFKFLKMPDASVNIYLINAFGMKQLNREYRRKDTVTDVIAIEQPKGFPPIPSGLIGEIYLNPPCVKKKGYSIEYALIHGILHLRGFNHLSKSDKIEMEKSEKKILAWLTNIY
jgi:probable rRNA maturation factor